MGLYVQPLVLQPQSYHHSCQVKSISELIWYQRSSLLPPPGSQPPLQKLRGLWQPCLSTLSLLSFHSLLQAVPHCVFGSALTPRIPLRSLYLRPSSLLAFLLLRLLLLLLFRLFSLISSLPSPRLRASGPLFYLCARTLQPAPSQSSRPLCLSRQLLRPLRLLSPPPPPSARRAPGLQESTRKMRQERRSQAARPNPGVARKPVLLCRRLLPAPVLMLRSGPGPPRRTRG